jgi:two-component system, OmpR family, manganese sensing sensor histidine kinase
VPKPRSSTYTPPPNGSRSSVREQASSPLALERRLLLSYLAVFAATFLVAALAVRTTFVASLDRQTTTRLEVLARAGLRSTLFTAHRLVIDKKEIADTTLLEREQGLQWLDGRRRRLASEGLAPDLERSASDGRGQSTVGNQTFNTVAIPILNSKTHERVGTVIASEWNERERADIQWLDTGLVTGTVLAIVGSCLGGLALTRRAVRPVTHTVQTLREFTADASHELRGPLTAIASNADAALRDAERNPARDRTRFEAIAHGAKQMSRLTSDLLLLASADRSLERELFVVDLGALLEKLTSRYGTRFALAGIALHLIMDETAIVYGNPDQIERILANLVENALRYTRAGGSVSIETARKRTEVVIMVRDTGIGIAPEHLDRIFGRFWRADPVRSEGGSGLGLAIARALARRHGGDVTVSSRIGLGSEFVVSFPTRLSRIDAS